MAELEGVCGRGAVLPSSNDDLNRRFDATALGRLILASVRNTLHPTVHQSFLHGGHMQETSSIARDMQILMVSDWDQNSYR
jgi:hypothetical protein